MCALVPQSVPTLMGLVRCAFLAPFQTAALASHDTCRQAWPVQGWLWVGGLTQHQRAAVAMRARGHGQRLP